MSRKNHVKVDGKLLQTDKRLWIRLEIGKNYVFANAYTVKGKVK